MTCRLNWMIYVMQNYEFMLAAERQDNPGRCDVMFVTRLARCEHNARRELIARCLRNGYWVESLVSVEDIDGNK